jgi:hypothetical protein
MKKYLIAITCAFVAATLTVSAQDEKPKKKELTPEQKEAAKKKMLEKYDANKNGKLDPEEQEAAKKDGAGKKKKKA